MAYLSPDTRIPLAAPFVPVEAFDLPFEAGVNVNVPRSAAKVGASREEAKRQRELLAEFDKLSSQETHPESAGFFGRVKEFFGNRASQV